MRLFPQRQTILAGQLWKGFLQCSGYPRTASCSYRRFATALPDHPAYKDAEEASKPKAVKDRRKPRYHHAKEGMDLPPLKNNPTMGLQPFDPSGGRKYNLRGVNQDGEVIGKRIYLPNIIISMVRNGVKPGEPYNPYKATFHVPVSLTKNDIKSYLLAVYGVETTYINTEIPHVKGKKRGQPLKSINPKPKYKRTIVGLVEPFYYPDDPSDMSTEEFEEYEEEQVDRGRTVMAQLRKLNPVDVMKRAASPPRVGEFEEEEMKKRKRKELELERGRERLESVTPEVISQLISEPVEKR